jgi:dihydrofolate reductase
MQVKLIYAHSTNGVIGVANALPWHLPEDLVHFKTLTAGAPVIMGRKTWDSLPPRFRPLPGRHNIVLTRQSEAQAPGAQIVHSLTDAFGAAATTGADVAWIVGGAELYRLAQPYAHQAEVTEVHQHIAHGDAFAPQLGDGWVEIRRTAHTATNGLRYDFITFEQAQPRRI